MAKIQQKIKELSGADDKARQARERLELLKNSAEAHLKLAEDKISSELSGDAGGLYNLFIIPETTMAFNQGYTVTASEKIDQGVTDAIDEFFSGDTKEGFKKIVQSGLSALFADTTTGESQKEYYFVAMEHNAFIRVDVSIWKYYFSQKSIQDDVQQAFCYTFCKSVIDHTKVSMDVLIFLVSTYIGDDLSRVKSYIDQMRHLYDELAPKAPHEVASVAMPLLRRRNELLSGRHG